MLPKAHLFVVDNDTMPIHIQKGFCGIVDVGRLNRRRNLNGSYFGQIADLMNISVGDLVYFYMMRKVEFYKPSPSSGFEPLEQGYYGVFRVCGLPFTCQDQVDGTPPLQNYRIFGSPRNRDYPAHNRQHKGVSKGSALPVLSRRIPIEPIPEYETDFCSRVVDDNHAYVDRTDEGQLNTLLFKKIKRVGEERSITPILPEEASKIARLIFKSAKRSFPIAAVLSTPHRCPGIQSLVDIDIVLSGDEVQRESMLEAYILRALNRGLSLGDLDGPIGAYKNIEYCGNQVQYGISGNKVDILLLHRKALGGSTSYRYQATVLELKKGRIDIESIRQIIDYQKWIAQLVTYNNISSIQPILVGKKPSSRMPTERKTQLRGLLDRIDQSAVRPPIFVEYPAKSSKVIDFTAYDIRSLL